jgi:hypothetical protein
MRGCGKNVVWRGGRIESEVSQAIFYFFSFSPAKQERKKQNP